MRRAFTSLVAFAAATAFIACEDGPNQTYSPAAPGAGALWQGTDGGTFAEGTGKDFGTIGGSSNKNEICDPQTKHTKWAGMVEKKILPPSAAGINVLGGDDKHTTYAGLTVDLAEDKTTGLCQSTPIGAEYTDNNPCNAWGDNDEVTLCYFADTRRIIQLEVHRGYRGTLDATSRDGMHKYVISADNLPILKDNKPFVIDWAAQDDTLVKLKAEINELYDAYAATYSSYLPEPDCNLTNHCSVADFQDGGGYLSLGRLGILIRVASTVAPSPVPSTPERIILRPKKELGFSTGDVTLKLDAAGEGPVAFTASALGTNKACTVKMGLDFGTFSDNCVTVYDPTDKTPDGQLKNDVELAKLYGGFSHDAQTYSFDVPGLNSSIAAGTLKDNDVIRDADKPQRADILRSIVVSGSTIGNVTNDFVGNDVTQAKDYHGLGLVTLEWANLLENYFTQLKSPDDPTKWAHLGDARCLAPNNPATVTTVNCTGLEGVVTTAPLAAIGTHADMAKNALGPNARAVGISASLKPATWASRFCNDANGNLTTGYKTCAGAADSYFTAAYNQIKTVWAKGIETNIPVDARDVRFAFKQWIFALVKYLQVADNAAATFDQVDAGVVSADSIFFDAIGAGQYEFAEYVDRHLVNSKSQAPLDLVMSADILHGIISDFEFSRVLYRGETAVYATMKEDTANLIGAESAFLMNIVGNPIVAGLGYVDIEGGWTAYQCASQNVGLDGIGPHDDKCTPPGDGALPQQALTDSDGNTLLNDSGLPILIDYKGAFPGSQTTFTVGLPTALKLTQTYLPIREAMVAVPIFANPYDPASMRGPDLNVLIPWAPLGANEGFEVARNGSQDQFIPTHNLDFSGTTVSLNVDYTFPADPKTGQEDQTQAPIIRAVETQDFLGELFACQDQNTGDILRVRMYTSARFVLDWLSTHAGTFDDCDVVVQYSQFGNYPDFITFRANGLRFGINPGAGFGRVVDATVYDISLNPSN